MLKRVSAISSRVSAFISSIELSQHPKAGTCISIRIRNGPYDTNMSLPLVWFRDHCRGQHNHATDQEVSAIVNIMERAQISRRNAVTYDNGRLSINWDDGHKSVFDNQQLMQLLVNPQENSHILHHFWKGSELCTIPTIDKATFSFAEFCGKFVEYGIVAVEGVEPTMEATKRIVGDIAPFHGTHYGNDMWMISNNHDNKDGYLADDDYTNAELAPHTDLSSFSQAPGMLVFHCLQPAIKGGETTLVDAFAAAEILKVENPTAFRILSETPTDHRYEMRGSNPLIACARNKPLIELNEDGGYEQIRFNLLQRSPLRLNGKASSKPEQITAFYEAYQSFVRICLDPRMAITHKLQPGTVLIVDNFRVLHARSAFTGARQMTGCYLFRDTLMAAARAHLHERI